MNDLRTWMWSEIAIARRELELHKDRCLPQVSQAIRREAELHVMGEAKTPEPGHTINGEFLEGVLEH